MQIALKLLFDISLYYSVVGFYFTMLVGEKPSRMGFLCLLLPVIAVSLIQKLKQEDRALSRASICLPLIFFLFRPEFSQTILILPPWVYLGWSIWRNRLSIDYAEAKTHFSFGLELLLLLLFGMTFWKKLPLAVRSTVPFIVLMLSSSVTLLRMLREKRSVGSYQCVLISIFLVCGAAVTLGKVPKLFAKGLGVFYHFVIVPIAKYIILAVAWIASRIVDLLKMLSLGNSNRTDELVNIDTAEEMLGLDFNSSDLVSDLAWLRIVLIALGVFLAVFIIFLIFRKIAGDSESNENGSPFSEKTENITAPGNRMRKGTFLRPAAPRATVRYYYAKFLRESLKRGKNLPNGLTVSEYSDYSADVFSGVDPATLANLYYPARYSEKEPITSIQADQAAAAWAELKASKKPTAADS